LGNQGRQRRHVRLARHLGQKATIERRHDYEFERYFVPKLVFLAVPAVLVAMALIGLWFDRDAPAVASSAAKSGDRIEESAVSPGVVYSTVFSDLQGHRQTLGRWSGKLVVVNFWATWCGPCKEEIPILTRLQDRFGSRGLQIVGIAADSSANIANFAQNTKFNYPSLFDEAGSVEFSKRLGNRLGLLPHTVMIAPGGTVVYNKLGAVSEGEFADIIEKNILIVR
jgi:thiol-disulfide isomerase/thioredoxin